MPLHEACFHTSTGKIYGVQENFILKFNGTTGAKEASALVCAPCDGPMRIASGPTAIYVASADDRSMNESPPVANNMNIWTVDPVTLAVVDTLGINAKFLAFFGALAPGMGPRAMVFFGNELWFILSNAAGHLQSFIDVSAPATYDLTRGGLQRWIPELFDVDGTHQFIPDPAQTEVEIQRMSDGISDGYSPCAPDVPVAAVLATNVNLCYAVCGTESLRRCDTFGSPGTSTLLNLGLVEANVTPMRIRYCGVVGHPYEGKLFIPSQSTDSIIIWNPVTDLVGDAVLKSGFESPIDVVFTLTKVFAVQTAPLGLKEIT